MAGSEPARKTRAIMFSDIQGYSKLMGEDEPLALRLLEEHNLLCVPLIKRHGGTPLKFIGDAILSAFESAADAVTAGLELQRLLAERNASRPDIVPLMIRIGIHIGDVVYKDGDVFGDGVNIAARIEPLAEPGGIAISQTVYDMIKARPEIQTVSLGSKELKNIKEAVNIYKVLVGAAETPSETADWAWLGKAVVIAAAAVAVAVGVVVRARRPAPAQSPIFPSEPPPVPVEASAPQPPKIPGSAATPAPAAPPTWRSPRNLDRNDPRVRERDDAYWAIRNHLLDASLSEAEKQRLALDFFARYHADPGLHPGYAWELAQHLPQGPAKDETTAVAESSEGREAAARVRIKAATAAKIDEALKIPAGPERRKFNADCPINTNGWIVELRPGEPAFDAEGRVTFKYRPAPGQERSVLITGDVLKPGPAGEPAVARAADAIAADYLKSR